MAKEYIEREALIKKLEDKIINPQTAFVNNVLIGLLKEAPAVDVVEVVCCYKCQHYNPANCSDGFGWCEKTNYGVTDEHYCSYGERKDGVD